MRDSTSQTPSIINKIIILAYYIVFVLPQPHPPISQFPNEVQTHENVIYQATTLFPSWV